MPETSMTSLTNSRFLQVVVGWSRPAKRAITAVADASIVMISLWAALAIQAESLALPVAAWASLFLLVGLLTVTVFAGIGLYRAVVRYFGSSAIFAIVGGLALVTALLATLDRYLGANRLSLSTLALFFGFASLAAAGARVFVRHLFMRSVGRKAERVVIYGAGDAGARMCAALMGGRDAWPVAFLDDKRTLQGSVIHGVEVYSPDQLANLIRHRDVTGVLLALPSASRRRRREILATLEPFGLHVRSLPHLSEIMLGQARNDEIREVDVADLLGRDAVPPNPQLLDACIFGKSVLVTGAGGSIGSELCRQIVRQKPSSIVLVETSELALYQIDLELRAICEHEHLSVTIVSLLGNAHHRDRVVDVLSTYRVQTVYHAAAYKHVPIVEQNIIEGIHNNVMSTWNTAEAALACGVETFVLVSTDKAVNPTNVMGATKRVAEIILQGLHQRSTRTRFCMVRFGNVLASSGSVVPRFYEQIRNGGPITVTHPDVTRYFMTIPEAAQLVLQAGSMARGGDVFVLDMGKPVKIAELARRMVNLMGLTVRDEANPDGDIDIAYTGLRPAEKLYEELLIGNNVSGTDHPMIMRAVEHALPWDVVDRWLHDMLSALRGFDCNRALELLQVAVVEYKASPELHDLVTLEKSAVASGVSKITDFAARRSRQALN